METEKPLGLIGREFVLIERLARTMHTAARRDYDYTPLRETADRRGQWFEVRLADHRIARVTIVLDRIEVPDGT